MSKVFAGVEGGASFCRAVLLNEKGEALSWAEGGSLNHLLIGIDECHKRIYDLLECAKERASLDPLLQLDSIGLCMSGCEQEEGNRKLKKEFINKYPTLAKSVTVSSDVIGSMKTALPGGGVLLIAGTGSNCLLVNPDDSVQRCGGWGHLLGDEAAGIWIAFRGIKYALNEEENFHPPPYSAKRMRELVLEHFQIDDTFGLLPYMYTNFRKPFIASFCEKIARGAVEGDKLCQHLFFEAGQELGHHIMAVYPKMKKELFESSGGLPILCVGSVFKSIELLIDGFKEVVCSKIKEFTLLRLTTSAAVGAAFYGAFEAGHKIPVNFKENFSILYHYKA